MTVNVARALALAVLTLTAACREDDGGFAPADLAHDAAPVADLPCTAALCGSHDLATRGDLASAPDLGHASDLAGGGVDGPPMRRQCISSGFGSALTARHGRLDGYLVAVVPINNTGCRGDDNHVRLQVLMGGRVYDIAVNVQDNSGADVFFLALDGPLPGPAWSEGWHPEDTLSYTGLGFHANDFTPVNITPLTATLQSQLEQANHVSIFGTGYSGGDGAHLIHYQGGGNDGAIVINPLSATARLFLFHFADQSF